MQKLARIVLNLTAGNRSYGTEFTKISSREVKIMIVRVAAHQLCVLNFSNATQVDRWADEVKLNNIKCYHSMCCNKI